MQWGRVELGVHHYDRAIDFFQSLRTKRPDDPCVVTHLARALQQFGALEQAIEVLEQGVREFPDNVAIGTSLGVNLERAKHDDRALPLLRQLLQADAGNARAALSLVRIHLRANDYSAAAECARRAEQKASDALNKTFALMARGEILMYENKPEVVAELLESHIEEDEGVGTLLIEALLRASECAATSGDRLALINKAAAIPISTALSQNVPVQIVLVRLAVARRDRQAFERALANLASTRIDLAELERLQSMW
jgi:predicted Zn-dependent protease